MTRSAVTVKNMSGPTWDPRRSPWYDVTSDPPIEEKLERVRAALRPGRLGSEATIVSVQRDDDAALLVFEWPDEPKPLAMRIELADTSREFYYGDPVPTFDDWLEYLDVYVMVSLDTGVVTRARRIDRGDYVELVGT